MGDDPDRRENRGPCVVVKGAEEDLAALPAEVAQFVLSRSQAMDATCRYCHIMLTVGLDEVYVLRGPYDDVRVYSPPSVAPRVLGNYIFFAPSGKLEATRPGEASIWILSDWRDQVAVSSGQALLRLSELGPRDQEMILVCQVKITQPPAASTNEGEKGEDDAE